MRLGLLFWQGSPFEADFLHLTETRFTGQGVRFQREVIGYLVFITCRLTFVKRRGGWCLLGTLISSPFIGKLFGILPCPIEPFRSTQLLPILLGKSPLHNEQRVCQETGFLED